MSMVAHTENCTRAFPVLCSSTDSVTMWRQVCHLTLSSWLLLTTHADGTVAICPAGRLGDDSSQPAMGLLPQEPLLLRVRCLE